MADAGRSGRIHRFLKESLLPFLKENFLKAVLLAAVTGAMVGWLKGVVAGVLPGTEPTRCWIEERWQATFRAEDAHDPGQFVVLVTRLAGDPDGSETKHLVDAFLGEKGFQRLTTCQVVPLRGEDQNAAEETAEAKANQLRATRRADLVLWGEVADRGALRVWMTAPAVRADLKAKPWVVDKGVLEPAFQEQFALALQAVVLTAVKQPSDSAEGKTFADMLGPLLPRLGNLVSNPPTGLSDDAKGSIFSAAGRTFESYGNRVGDMVALNEAVETYRATLEVLTRDRVPLDWARAENSLGHALFTLGTRESGTSRLEEALEAYRAALEERRLEVVPYDWADTERNLGQALFRLGEREPGSVLFDKAAAAYRAALEVQTRAAAPMLWAGTEIDLGNALVRVGEQEISAPRLKDASAAYRAALEELTHERNPFDWAAAELDLGNALEDISYLEPGTARLEEALAAYHMALEEWTRERSPFYWALTQNNIGNTLTKMGERQTGSAELNEAIAAYRSALEERTRKEAPYQWAMTQASLGNALRALGERETGIARLEEAVAAYRSALEEWTREKAPYQWAMTQVGFGHALRALGERETGTARLEEAVAIQRAALGELEGDQASIASAQNGLGYALSALGERESGTRRLEEAISAFRAALVIRIREKVPLQWAESFGGEGVALMLIADRTNDPAAAAASLSQIQAASDAMRSGGDQHLAGEFQARLTKAQAIVDRLQSLALSAVPSSQAHPEMNHKRKVGDGTSKNSHQRVRNSQ